MQRKKGNTKRPPQSAGLIKSVKIWTTSVACFQPGGIHVYGLLALIPPFSPHPHSLPTHCLLSLWYYFSTCPIARHSAFSEKGVVQKARWHLMTENNWILCPICRNKTRIKIRGDTVLENFPLYCPKCKQENLIRAYQLNIIVIKEPDAQTQSR